MVGFKFIWSKKVDDLYNTTDRFTSRLDMTSEEIDKFIKDTVELYQDTDLKKALSMGYEIMFKCKAYYLSKKSYVDFIRK